MLKKDFLILFTLTFFFANLKSEALDRLKKKHFGPHVVGGVPVSIKQYPFAVQFFNFGAMCAGVIINNWSVITAAHCLANNVDMEEMSIHVGSRHILDMKAKKHTLQSFVLHENYSQVIPFEKDIAILFVKKPIQFNKLVKKAIIVDSNKWMSPKEKKFVVTGWGWQKYGGPVTSKDLMMAVLRYVSAKQCSQMHNVEFSKDMFCLYGNGTKDICRGDSGGGVLWRGRVVGLASHGDGCAQKNKPSVYANLWYLRGWIKKQLSKFISNDCKQQKRNPRAKSPCKDLKKNNIL